MHKESQFHGKRHDRAREELSNTNDARVINLLEEQKYPSNRKTLEEPSTYELPYGYNQTRLVAMVRDPHCIYGYWEVTDDQVQNHRNNHGLNNWDAGHWVLRTFDHTQGEHFDSGIDLYARNWYIDLANDGHTYQLSLGRMLSDGHFAPLIWSNKVTTPPEGVSDLIDEQWMALDEIYSFRVGAENLTAGTSPGIIRAISLEKEAGSAAILNISSPLGGKEVQKDFWLKLEGELILYGSTEPDAKVTVQGQEIKLRSDGTFSLRYAFNDGTLVFPVQATSAQEDTITITPVFSRETY